MPQQFGADEHDAADRPLSARELMLKDDIPPLEELPPAIQSALSTSLSSARTPDVEAQLRAITETLPGQDASYEQLLDEALVEVHLPCHPGQELSVDDLAEVNAPAHGDAGAPLASIGIAFLPKPSIPDSSRVLRRRSGRSVLPVDCSTQCTTYSYGGESRGEYVPNGYPWVCIGKVFVYNDAKDTSPSSTGSGVLVGRNVVVTASHVMPWGRSNPKIRFIAGSYDGNDTSSSWVDTWEGVRNFAQGDDIAVMKLSSALGDALGYFGYQVYTDSWEDEPYWTQCGYPCDKNSNRPYREFNIAVKDDDSEGDGVELEHESDIACGMSGGPLWAMWNTEPRVIGVLSGHEGPDPLESSNVSAGGQLLANMIVGARAKWQPKSKEGKDKEKEPHEDKKPDGKGSKDDLKMVDSLRPLIGRTTPAGEADDLGPGSARAFIRAGERPEVGGPSVFGDT